MQFIQFSRQISGDEVAWQLIEAACQQNMCYVVRCGFIQSQAYDASTVGTGHNAALSAFSLCFSLVVHMNDGWVAPHLPPSSVSRCGSLSLPHAQTHTHTVKSSSVNVEQRCPILLVMDEVMGLVHPAPLYHVFPTSHSTSNKLLLISIPFLLCSRCWGI